MAKKKEAPGTELANSQSVREELRSFIERWEALEADKRAQPDNDKGVDGHFGDGKVKIHDPTHSLQFGQ